MGPMKLSEAVVLGVPEVNFTNDAWYGQDGETCRGCLVGAALFATGHKPPSEAASMRETIACPIQALEKEWPWTARVPMEEAKKLAINYMVTLLMDWPGSYEHNFLDKFHFTPISQILTVLAEQFRLDHMSLEQVAHQIQILEAKYDTDAAPTEASMAPAGELVAR